MKNAKKLFLCIAVVAYLYIGLRAISRDITSASTDYLTPPDIFLTNGRVAVPNARTSVAFVRGTAHDTAMEFFADAEETPSLDEFLTLFFCNACSRNCLILTPRCVAGRTSNNQAVNIYKEMFPHMEVFI